MDDFIFDRTCDERVIGVSRLQVSRRVVASLAAATLVLLPACSSQSAAPAGEAGVGQVAEAPEEPTVVEGGGVETSTEETGETEATGDEGSQSDETAPSGIFGTKGVEVTFTFTTLDRYKDKLKLRIKNRNGDKSWDLAPGESTTIRGEANVADDVEVELIAVKGSPLTDSARDMDFSNPSAACPNASFASSLEYFCKEGTWEGWTVYTDPQYDTAQRWTVKATREKDSDSFKRFSVTVDFPSQFSKL